MIRVFTLFVLFNLTVLSINGQTVYVKSDATGANNGSSWADAYSDLRMAIGEAPEGADLWIASGTYVTGVVNRSFYLEKTMNLYGGFIGTETSFDQRNITANLTILSGDNNGDDQPGNRLTNREDNSTHVLFFEKNLENILVDGLTIKGGHTNRGEDPDNLTQLGGGIYSEANSFTLRNCIVLENSAAYGGGVHIHTQPNVQALIENCTIIDNGADFRGGGFYHRSPNANITIRNTIFDDNLARFGAAVYFGEAGANMTIEDCQFTNGFVTGLGAGVYVTLSGQATISNSLFEENWAYDNGGGLFARNAGTKVIVENCDFKNNKASNDGGGRGGAIGISVEGDLMLNSCNILNNSADQIGGGVYIEGATATINESFISSNTAEDGGGGIISILEGNLTLNNTTISENTATDGHGGGVYLQDSGNYSMMSNTFSKNTSSKNGGGLYLVDAGTVSVNNCQFLENNCEDSGGGVYVQDSHLEIDNAQFSKNKANWGGGISNSFEGAMATVTNSTFTENEALSNGGGLEAYGEAIYVVDQCNFKNNRADYGGGINLESEGTKLMLMNSTFEDNEVQVQGGALGGFNGTVSKVYNTSFLRNIANRNGGAVSISAVDIVTENQIFDACIFDGNQAFLNSEGQGGYGGALICFNTNAKISNSLFINNSCVSGGTVQANDYDDNQDVMYITNCTFANNDDAGTASIYAWEDGTGDQVNLILQNNLFGDAASGFKNEEGTANITSNGGNLSNNESLLEVLVHAKDQHNTNPNFKNSSNDFRLASNSLAINAGVNDNAPQKDLAGNDRDGLVDIGAFESQEVTSLFKTVESAGQLSIFPNPVGNELHFNLESDWNDEFNLSIVNIKGQTIWSTAATKSVKKLQKTLPVAFLPAATYLLRIQQNGRESSALFVKTK